MSPVPAFKDDFSTDNSATWQFDAYLGGGGDGGAFGGNSWDLTAFPGNLYVASEAGAPHEFVTIAAAGHDFTVATCNVVAVQMVGFPGGTDRAHGVSVGLANLTAPYNELVASLNGNLLGLCLGHSPDLTSTLIDIPDTADGFACDNTLPLWLALVLDGPDTLACVYDTDPFAGGALPTPRAKLKWSDYAVAQGQPADPTTGLGTCVPQLGFWLTGISPQDTMRVDNWEAGEMPRVQPDNIKVGAQPNSIPADGTSQSDVTALVRDHTGAGVPGLAVVFTPAAHFGGAVTDNGDGSYDTLFTSDTNPGSVEVQAKTGTISATTSIQQRPPGDIHAGPPQVGIVKRGPR
jgi:hypothetical protein